MITIFRRLTVVPTRLFIILPGIWARNILVYYFLILLLQHMENDIHNIFCNIMSSIQTFLQTNPLFIIMLYLYLSHKTTIKLSHIIASTLKKYENTDTNVWLQLDLISSCKLESTAVWGIALGCPGCKSSNYTWAVVVIEKSNIYQDFKNYVGWYIIIFWEGLALKIWSLGLVIVCVSLLLWCTLFDC